MDELTTYFDALFNKINYSSEIQNTKDDLMKIVSSEYRAMTESRNDDSDIIGELIVKYGSVEKINKALNSNLIIGSDTHNDYLFMNIFNRNKMYITIISLLISFIVAFLFVLNIYNFIVLVTLQVIFLSLIIFFYQKLIKNKCVYKDIELTPHTVSEFQEKSLKVHRKFQYSIIAFIALIILGLSTYLNLMSYSHIGWQEGLTYGHFSVSSIGLYFCIKNYFILKEIKAVFGLQNQFKNYTRKLLIYSVLFWLVYIVIQIIYYYFIYNDLMTKLMMMTIFIYIFVMYLYVRYQYKIRSTLTLKVKLKKVFIMSSVVLLGVNILLTGEFWALQPYISTIPSVKHDEHKISYNDDGSYSIYLNRDEEFHVLQLTDIHLGGSFYTLGEDQNALTAVYDLIENTKPDLVVVTGDFVFSVGLFSLSLNNYTPMLQFASFMRNIGIPWTFVYGNHDTEGISTSNSGQINKLFEQFSYENTGSLLYSSKQPPVTGRYNQYIKILNSDGSVNQVLFLLDSNEYIGGMTHYDYIRDDQVEWYKGVIKDISKEESKVVSSLLFFHIPLKEFEEAYHLYKNNDTSVQYYFGTVGEKNEAISSSQYDSRLFDVAKELKSTKAMFVGHDHYNNISLGYEGIRLTFSRSIDYLAMPGISKKNDQRGATFIKLKPNSDIDVESIKLSDIRK